MKSGLLAQVLNAQRSALNCYNDKSSAHVADVYRWLHHGQFRSPCRHSFPPYC